jgi:hypothetical protein
MIKILDRFLDLLMNPLVFGVILFIIFAIDLEYDRDFWTWLWLLYAQLNIMTWAIRKIKQGDRDV